MLSNNNDNMKTTHNKKNNNNNNNKINLLYVAIWCKNAGTTEGNKTIIISAFKK